LGLDEVSDTSLGHHRDGDGIFDLLDHIRVRHAGHSTIVTDIGCIVGDTFKLEAWGSGKNGVRTHTEQITVGTTHAGGKEERTPFAKKG
jgi:hypothetical protein